MGIENRDYYREPPGRGGGGGWGSGAMAPVCKYLIIANIVVFLLQIFITRPPAPDDIRRYLEEYGQSIEELPEEERPTDEELAEYLGFPRISVVQQWLQLEADKVLRQAQVWRLLSCAFCHDRLSLWHILFNMLFLYWFGRTLESMYGSREFLFFYLTAAVVASLAYVGLDLVTGDARPAIGASGAVMAVSMLYAIHFPRDRILVFFLIPIEIRWLVLFYVIYDLHPVLLALAGDHLHTGVAHAAHLGGLAFGYLYWKTGVRLERLWDRRPRFRFDRLFGSRRNIRVFRPSQDTADEKLEAQVDEILEKILNSGEGSLTDEEREVLRAASERYKGRSGR